MDPSWATLPTAVALRTPIDESPEDVRAALAPLRHPFSVAVYNCQNAFSVGAIIRVAHNFLAREIFVIGRAPYYEKASMGMEKYESIVMTEDKAEFLDRVKGRPLWAFEREAATRSLYDPEPFPPRWCCSSGASAPGCPTRCCAPPTWWSESRSTG